MSAIIDFKRNFTIHPKAAAPIVRAIGYTLDDVYDFCITSANTFTFTVMFDFINPEDNRLMRAVITKVYNHAYYLD